jgi:hydroxylamine dehydrogenase
MGITVLADRFMLRVGLAVGLTLAWAGVGSSAPVSESSQECIECHKSVAPDHVASWKKSLHSRVSPAEAIQKKMLERKVSAEKVPEALAGNVVGCAECHTMNPEKHKDTFDHNGYKVHVVVTPADCSTCHSAEAAQYTQNLMSHARTNLVNNDLYQDFMRVVNGMYSFHDGKLQIASPGEHTNADSCLYCHGTAVEVKGLISKETDMGSMEFPVLSGWPNQGVGRLNPDGSSGTCAACHIRHLFPIEMARKPQTCSECHKGPDVPAYKVYEVSKHGNTHAAMGGKWNFDAVPWTVGKDFNAPTCAVCHVSLVVNEAGEIVAERTHRMNDRLPWRILGLIYAHPHPKSPDLTVVRNKAGLPLPTELTGQPVAEYLIDTREQTKRRETMQKVCLSCHSSSWVNNQWDRFEHAIKTTNENTLAATQILLTIWDKGLAKGIPHNSSIFDESIEQKWTEQWFFYANSIRFSSAMFGADYGVFEHGRWALSKGLEEMRGWLEERPGRGR